MSDAALLPPPDPASREPDPSALAEALAYARSLDPVGDAIHVGLGVLSTLLLPVATFPKDAALILLLIVAVVRLRVTVFTYAAIGRGALGWLLLGWVGWRVVSFAWSADVPQGLDELRAMRMLLLLAALWPVLDRAGLFVGAFLLGVAGQNAVQVFQVLGVLGFALDENGRADGLLHPIQVGSFCVAALGWHAALALRGRHAVRLVAIAGLLLAGAGLVWSGSRGPWLGAAAGALLVVPVGLLGRSRRTVLVALAVGAVAIGVTGFAARGLVIERWTDAWSDLAAAREGRFDTNLGQRLVLYDGARRIARDAPLVGVGAGGFQSAFRTLEPDADVGSADHAHSTYLHELASVGAVGTLMMLLAFGVVAWRSVRDPDDAAWRAGTLFVVVSWLVAAAFDAYHLNGHMLGLFALVATITTRGRPAHVLDDTDRFRPEDAEACLKDDGARSTWRVVRPGAGTRTVKAWPLDAGTAVTAALGRAQPQRHARAARRFAAHGLATPAVVRGPRLAWRGGVPLLALELEFVPGRDALAVLRGGGTVTAAAGAGTLVRRIADAGLLHRDLKLRNVLVADDGRILALDLAGVRPARDRSVAIARMLERLAIEPHNEDVPVAPGLVRATLRAALSGLDRPARRAVVRRLRTHRPR